MGNKRGESMNEKNTESLLDLINNLITLIGTNTDHINRKRIVALETRIKELENK